MGCLALSYYEQALPKKSGRSVFLSTAKAAQRCPQGNEKSCAGSYKFGFNGQEKVNEIAGIGNHTTALFWEYDTRIARRWNIDPVDQISISNYSVMRLNPIFHNDPLGNTPNEYEKNAKTGAIKQTGTKGGDEVDYITVKNDPGSSVGSFQFRAPAGDYTYSVPVKTTVSGDYSSDYVSYRGPGEKIIKGWSDRPAQTVDDPFTSLGPSMLRSGLRYGVEKLTTSLAVKESKSIVFHSTTRPGAAQSILEGINPQYFNSSSRFGRAFYVANSEATTISELAFHGYTKVNTIQYTMVNARIMNATRPIMGLGVKYAPKTLGLFGRSLGFDGVMYNSLRHSGGINTAIFRNFGVLQGSKLVR